MIVEARCRGLISGIKLAKEAPTISHLLYADELLLFCKASIEIFTNLKSILEKFTSISGQLINFQKSRILCSSIAPSSMIRAISKQLNMPPIPESFTYLGLPIFWGKRSVDWFKPLLHKVERKIQGWKQSKISFAVRSVLIQSVSNVLGNYLNPKKILKIISFAQARFCWGKSTNRFCRLMKWRDMCTPKRNGGAGFCSLGNVNLALLTKLAWRLVSDPNALVSKILFAKYGKKYGWWNSHKSLASGSKLGKWFVWFKLPER